MGDRTSVVIPVFNRADYTRRCLDSIFEHTPGPVEVIVIDNASSDQTRSLLAATPHPIVVHRNPVNLGFARACNQGAARASGNLLVFLNNDTLVHPGWLAPLLDELSSHPNTAVVGSRLLYPDGSIQHAGVAIGRDQVPFHIHSGSDADAPLVNERRCFPVVTAACCALRRNEFFDIGKFDEGFVNGHEDIDLCMRFREAGRDVVYRPDSVVTHYESVSEGRMDKRPQNLRRTFKKWRRRLVQDDFAYQVPLSAKTGRRFAIKIGVPDRTQSHWGDIYFAEGLAKALCRQGHECEIHYLCEWGQPDRDIDVVVHIKGLSEYVPKPHNVNVMWMINHPDRHRDDELERYDLVCVASEPYARELQGRLRVPVLYLPQATEPDRFRPGATRDLELVFVGSNRGVGRKSMRRVIADLLPTRHRLAVWGDGWDGLLPDGVWQGPFVANDALPEIYGRAHVVLNDHHDDMRAAGFINNRTFDALACGAFVVSDAVPGLDAFDAVYTYRSRDELRSAVDALMKLPPPTERHVESFEDRARRLAEETVELQSRPASAEQTPLVSVLMATYQRRRFLPEAIASVRAQNYGNWELVVVNDGGPSVRDIVDGFDDKRIRLVELGKNAGKGHAINRAFAESTGAYIAYLDDDDRWLPEHLGALLEPLLTLPGIQFAYSDADTVTLERVDRGDYEEKSRELVHYHQVSLDGLLVDNGIQGISAMHARGLFEEAGGFDEALPVLLDWDMWRKLASLSPPYHVSVVTAEHHLRVSDSTDGEGQLTNFAGAKRLEWIDARLRILRKALPGLPAASKHPAVCHAIELSKYWRLIYEGESSGDSRFYERAHRMLPQELEAPRRLALLALKGGDFVTAEKLHRDCIKRGSVEVSDYLYASLANLKLSRPRVTLDVINTLSSRNVSLNEQTVAILNGYVNQAQRMLSS